jgi:hypothetical protein
MKRSFIEKAPKGEGAMAATLLFLFISLSGAGGFVSDVPAQTTTRIVVVPFYTEKGQDVKDTGYAAEHYRRVMRFINNQLARHGFEVVNPFAKELGEEEYNRVMQRSRQESILAAKEICKKYASEIAYTVWLTVQIDGTADRYCRARVRLDGEGYDSAGRDLGVGVYKTVIVTRRSCEDAIAGAEKEVGDLVGRRLALWRVDMKRTQMVSGGAGLAREMQKEDAPAQRAEEIENLVEIRLEGATEYTLSEIFGKVINTATGVTEAKRYASQIIPENPQASYVVWRVRIEGTDPFRLQANIIKMAHEILDAGGELYLKGVPYRYTADEVDLLKGIRPGDATDRRVQFVIDRELARDKELQGRHDPFEPAVSPAK